MNLILRIVFAIIAGVLTTGLLNYFGVLNANLNSLIGFLVALAVFFGADYGGRFGR